MAKWDSTILLLEATKGAEKRAALIEELREELNQALKKQEGKFPSPTFLFTAGQILAAKIPSECSTGRFWKAWSRV